MEVAKKVLKYSLAIVLFGALLINGVINYIEKEQLKNEMYMEMYGKEFNQETGRYE